MPSPKQQQIDHGGLTIRLKLDQYELEALRRAAAQELRLPPDQARYIIRQELIRQGLLALPQPESVNEP